MNEGTRRRLEVLETAVAPEDRPGPLRVHLRERSFESTEALQRWDREADERQARNPHFERQSITDLRLTVVRLCEPGEQPSTRDLGVTTFEALRSPARSVPL